MLAGDKLVAIEESFRLVIDVLVHWVVAAVEDGRGGHTHRIKVDAGRGRRIQRTNSLHSFIAFVVPLEHQLFVFLDVKVQEAQKNQTHHIDDNAVEVVMVVDRPAHVTYGNHRANEDDQYAVHNREQLGQTIVHRPLQRLLVLGVRGRHVRGVADATTSDRIAIILTQTQLLQY